FMGEEWGASTPWAFFTSHPEPELAEATRQGRLEEFVRMDWDPATVPDPQDPATFARSRLDWDEPGRDPYASLLEHHRTLIRLRRELPALVDPRRGAVTARSSFDGDWLRIDANRVTVAVNLIDEPNQIPLPGPWSWEPRYTFGGGEVMDSAGDLAEVGRYGQLVALAR